MNNLVAVNLGRWDATRRRGAPSRWVSEASPGIVPWIRGECAEDLRASVASGAEAGGAIAALIVRYRGRQRGPDGAILGP